MPASAGMTVVLRAGMPPGAGSCGEAVRTGTDRTNMSRGNCLLDIPHWPIEMIQILSPTRTYPPVGVCIYCLSKDGVLGREHIIPFGLGGKLVLPKASCRKCESITGRCEQFALRGMLGEIRVSLGLPTRNKRERPERLNLEIITPDGNSQSREVEIKDYPSYVILFLMEPPGVLHGRDPTDTITIKPRLIWRHDGAEPSRNWRTSLTVQPWPFLRMLAKIGHAFAVAELGWSTFNTFTPLLNEIILHSSARVSHFVGVIADADDTPSALHWLQWSTICYGDREFLVVDICLFTLMKAPVFRVVVGYRPMPEQRS